MVGTLRKCILLPVAVAALGVCALAPVNAPAETVEPLLPDACDKLRRGIENRVPFAPGFRRLRFEFPKNDLGIEGTVCRLLTLGTGVHMEGPGIESLKDMRTLISGALEASGWKESAATRRFQEKTKPGREVFGVEKSGAVCVATIVVGKVEGTTPPKEAMEGGKLHLGKLLPYQREWWISVDCFAAPGLQPKVAAPAAKPDAMGAMGAQGVMGAAPAGGAMAAPMPSEPLPPDPTAGAVKDALPAEPEPPAASTAEPMTETIQEAPKDEPQGVLPPEPPLK